MQVVLQKQMFNFYEFKITFNNYGKFSLLTKIRKSVENLKLNKKINFILPL